MAIAGPDFLLEDCQMEIPYGYCQCGCGQRTRIAPRNNKQNKWVKGKPIKYINGHRNKHGLCGTQIYKLWESMNHRCNHSTCGRYRYYGGRGIKICSEWQGRIGPKNFADFMISIGWHEECGLEIDRIDNELGYFPENVRLTTQSVNRLNTRTRLDNSIGYRGVSCDKRCKNNKYVSYISVNKKCFWFGNHRTAREAAIARDKFIIENKIKGAHTQVLK